MNSKLLRTLKGIVVLSLLFCASSYAQVKKITGKVTDSSDGGPMPGVNVSIKGQPSNVATNVDGMYTIQADPATDALVFSYIGFKRQTIVLAGKTTLNVSLASDNADLDEVIVVGYGTKKKSEILGSVASITGAEVMDIPAPNIAGALRNRIAGVGVSQASGRPGSAITLNIRNSTASETVAGATAEPLYIIDGITVDRNAFDAIDASMVENISFLKDASAAIYGAAGAKGVVLVTTKRGKIGKPGISYNGYMGVSDASRTPEMLSGLEHATLLNDTYKLYNSSESAFFTQSDLDYIAGTNYKSWYDELWKSATTQRHNLSISGGSDKITFFVGGSYQNENGNYAGLKVDKYGFRSGLTATIVEGLKADIAFNVDHNVRESQNTVSENDAGFFESIISVPRWVPISFDGVPVNFNNGSPRNPLAVLQSGYYENRKSQAYRVNASLTYQPKFLKGLNAKLQVSQGGGNSSSTQYEPPYKLFNFLRVGNNSSIYINQPDPVTPSIDAVSVANSKVMPGLGRDNSYQGFFTLQYGKTLGLHTFDAIVGGEQTESDSENLSVYWRNQLIPEADDWWAFDPNTLTRQNRDIFQSTKRSFFGRFSYDFNKKYLIEGVARLDASSNFASGNRWGLAPSIGLGWVVSQENFFKNNVSFVNFLKLKFNYGIVGDDRVTERLWQERYQVDVSNGYLFGGYNGNGLNPSVFPNPDITWEKKETINAGVEASFFDSRLDIGVEFFRNRTFDGFDRGNNNRYPLYAGFTAPVINYREAYNWGSEFSISYRANLAKDLKLSTSINFSYGNSVVDRMIYAPGNLQENRPNQWLALSFGTDPRKYNANNIGLKTLGMFRTQAEIDAFLLKNPNYTLYGVVPQPGWLYYEDANGDGVVNDLDMAPMYNNTNSFFASGISLNLSYKDFSLSTNILARLGGKVFYDSRSRIAPSNTRNILSIWQDRWTTDNPSEGKYPRFDDPSLTRNSDFWAVDGTTIRVNNMTLSYKVPSRLANRLGLGGARILATGNNLWTIVNPLKYKDPYTSSAYDYPILRTLSLGLSVNL